MPPTRYCSASNCTVSCSGIQIPILCFRADDKLNSALPEPQAREGLQLRMTIQGNSFYWCRSETESDEQGWSQKRLRYSRNEPVMVLRHCSCTQRWLARRHNHKCEEADRLRHIHVPWGRYLLLDLNSTAPYSIKLHAHYIFSWAYLYETVWITEW